MNKDFPKQRILIVDDSPINIKMLEATLGYDYNISASTDGLEAIEIAANINNAVDLILLDITMPDMDGYEVCRRLKADSRTAHIPVIFITARSEDREETKGFELGAVDYIRKPFSPAVVKARVKTHLDLKFHRDNLERVNELLNQEVAERKRTEKALRNLIKKQEVDISLAKKVLNLINGAPPRYIPLDNETVIFVEAISVPYYAEGGDHYFVKSFIPDRKGKTILSLKDQSGHEVRCLLKSIITDIMHHRILNKAYSDNSAMRPEDSIAELNDKICRSSIFDKEDFFTAVTAEVDHETLMLKYVSAGHPPFILIRGDNIKFLPEYGGPGANLPIAVKEKIIYSAGEYQLRKGDKLIFYTDGLVEMPVRNHNKMISMDELKIFLGNMIRQSERELSVTDIMYNILDVISKLSDEEIMLPGYKNISKNTSNDDITMICMEIENQNRYEEVIWRPRNYDDISRAIKKLYQNMEKKWDILGYKYSKHYMALILEEAVINAWKHGNKQNPDKAVTVRWHYGNDFIFEVIDEGNGFDCENLPDPTSEENLMSPSGRGIFIIRYFSDYVAWKEGGKHLVISFKKNRQMIMGEKQI